MGADSPEATAVQAVAAEVTHHLQADPTTPVLVTSAFGTASHAVCEQLEQSPATTIRLCTGRHPAVLPGQTLRSVWDAFAHHASDVPAADGQDAARVLLETVTRFRDRGGVRIVWCHLHNADRVTRRALAAVLAENTARRLQWVLGSSRADTDLLREIPAANVVAIDLTCQGVLDDVAGIAAELPELLAVHALSPDLEPSQAARALGKAPQDVHALLAILEDELIEETSSGPPAWLCNQAKEALTAQRLKALRCAIAAELIDHHPGRAAELLADAGEALAGEVRGHARALLGEALAENRLRDALELVEALEVGAPRAETTELKLMRARALGYLGRHDEAEAVIAALIADGLPLDATALAEITASRLSWSAGDITAARDHVEAAAALADTPQLRAEADVLSAVTDGDVRQLDPAIERLAGAPARSASAQGASVLARYVKAVRTGDTEDVEALIDETRASGDLELSTLGQLIVVGEAARAGRFVTAHTILRHTFAFGPPLADQWRHRPGALCAVGTYVFSGYDLDAVADLLAEYPSPPEAAHNLGPLLRLMALLAWTNGAAQLGKRRDAMRLLGATLAHLERLPAAASVFALDLLDAGASRDDIAAVWRKFEVPETPWTRARTIRRQAAAGKDIAEADLRRALETFVHLGAPVHAAAARVLLRSRGHSSGGAPPRTTESTLPALTPRQMEIARLAAAGAGNREIAARLGISDKTVRNQLSTVLRELGLQSRRDLARIGAIAQGD